MKLVGTEAGILKSTKTSRVGPLKVGLIGVILETGNYFVLGPKSLSHMVFHAAASGMAG